MFRGGHAARGAAARLETLRTAAELRRTRDELQSIRSRLETLPPGLARLSGNERSRIEELDADEARLREELSRCRAEIDEAEALHVERDTGDD